jgi:hypothetical protein
MEGGWASEMVSGHLTWEMVVNNEQTKYSVDDMFTIALILEDLTSAVDNESSTRSRGLCGMGVFELRPVDKQEVLALGHATCK